MERPKPKDEVIPLNCFVSVAKASYSLLHCALDFYCYQESVKTVSHTVALGDMYLHYYEHVHCNLFWVLFWDPKYTFLLPHILASTWISVTKLECFQNHYVAPSWVFF